MIASIYCYDAKRSKKGVSDMRVDTNDGTIVKEGKRCTSFMSRKIWVDCAALSSEYEGSSKIAMICDTRAF